jgi:hypothetical protein
MGNLALLCLFGSAALLLPSVQCAFPAIADDFDVLKYVDPLVGTVKGGTYYTTFSFMKMIETNDSQGILFLARLFHMGWPNQVQTLTPRITKADSYLMAAMSQDSPVYTTLVLEGRHH